MEPLRELVSTVLDLPWAVADGLRRAARPVRRIGEQLWSWVLDLPWLARDAGKRVELLALGHERSRLRATFVALGAAAAVLLVVPAVRYVASEAATGGVAGAATPDRRAAQAPQATPPARALERRARQPRIRARLGGARARGRLVAEHRTLIERLAPTARAPSAAAGRRKDRDRD